VASQRATCAPIAPVPPVISAVAPSGRQPGRGRTVPADLHAVVADRDLVLGAGQHGGEPDGGAFGDLGGQVDQTAPAFGPLQAEHPAQAPDRGLGRGRDRRDRTGGGDPQWSVTEGPHQLGGGRQPRGDRRGVGVRPLV
jgi:hypothetical protein